MIDFNFFLFCWLINVIVHVNWLQNRLAVLDNHGEHLSMVNEVFARLTFSFSIRLLPISSFTFLFLLKALIGFSWIRLLFRLPLKCSANTMYISGLSNNVANVWLVELVEFSFAFIDHALFLLEVHFCLTFWLLRIADRKIFYCDLDLRVFL